MIRHIARCTSRRMLTSSNGCVRLSSSTTPISPQQVNADLESLDKKLDNPGSSHSDRESDTSDAKKSIRRNGQKQSLVSKVFKSLKTKKSSETIEEILQSADSVEAVLSATEAHKFSQYHALQALSILAEWTTSKKIKMDEFESDRRFIDLCKMIGPKQKDDSNFGDLGVVMGVTGEDQAAKMVTGISFPQQIRVMSALALKKRRSLQLLRALAASISKSTETCDMKQAADVFYAMAVLSFPDKLLLQKACTDIFICLPDNKKPAVVGSVLTSIGILKYRNTGLLDELAKWVEDNVTVCREQDIVSLLLTLAAVNYHPQNAAKLYKMILPPFKAAILKPNVWLDVVWAFCVLNVAETHHLQSVLVPEFVERLTKTGYITNIPAPARLKLLNINAVAELTVKDYTGPLLADKSSLQFALQRSQEKQVLVDSVIESLKNLLPTPTYLHTDVDTGYGFLIDAECAVDAKCNPLPVEDTTTKPVADRKKIAVLVQDYHDVCRDSEDLCGPVVLQERLLKHIGYTVMTVSYLEFKPRDKLVSRVKYLEQKLKKLAALQS